MGRKRLLTLGQSTVGYWPEVECEDLRTPEAACRAISIKPRTPVFRPISAPHGKGARPMIV